MSEKFLGNRACKSDSEHTSGVFNSLKHAFAFPCVTLADVTTIRNIIIHESPKRNKSDFEQNADFCDDMIVSFLAFFLLKNRNRADLYTSHLNFLLNILLCETM